MRAQNEGEIAASNYHAGLTPKQRIQIQNQWRRGEVQVVVATIAFGMGAKQTPYPSRAEMPVLSSRLSGLNKVCRHAP